MGRSMARLIHDVFDSAVWDRLLDSDLERAKDLSNNLSQTAESNTS